MTFKELLFGHGSDPLDSVRMLLKKAESALVNGNLQNCYSKTGSDDKTELHITRAESRYESAKRYANKAKEIYKKKNIKDVSIENRIEAILRKV